MSTATAEARMTENLFKMRLRADEFLSDVSGNNGRFPKGSVLLVDEATAKRWYRQRIADIAPPDAPTHDEIVRTNKDEEFERLAQPAVGVFDRMVSRGDAQPANPNQRQMMPPPMPPRRGRRGNVAGAEIANGTDYDPLKDED